MSSAHQNLSIFHPESVPNGKTLRFAVVYAEWNQEVTESLKNCAVDTLVKFGAVPENIYIVAVPGTFELTAAAAILCETGKYDTVICLGCVIQGETRHFEFICQSVANGLASVSIKYSLPVIFGVLTTDNLTQAIDRSGGQHGNKGVEAAITALKMAAFRKSVSRS